MQETGAELRDELLFKQLRSWRTSKRICVLMFFVGMSMRVLIFPPSTITLVQKIRATKSEVVSMWICLQCKFNMKK